MQGALGRGLFMQDGEFSGKSKPKNEIVQIMHLITISRRISSRDEVGRYHTAASDGWAELQDWNSGNYESVSID